ncbi:TetR/AcrR family transcriptional regulator [Candidatus Eisenbacteria bacterium]|uniref:TetR/AcrR family transcriptional regulator n=1 Tax=Eiseniibacteriota bacterium TaxID=2212470 RepID=A0ABV6YLS5_UNCEI
MVQEPAPGRLGPEDFVNAGITIGDSKGYSAVTVRSIAWELGTTPMVLYRHFQSIEHFLAVVWNRCFVMLLEKMWPDRETPPGCVEEYKHSFRSIVSFAAAYPNRFWFMFSTWWATEPYGIPDERHNILARFVDLYRRGVECGDFRSDLDSITTPLTTSSARLGLAALMTKYGDMPVEHRDPNVILADGIETTLSCLTSPAPRFHPKTSNASAKSVGVMKGWCSRTRQRLPAKVDGVDLLSLRPPNPAGTSAGESDAGPVNGVTREVFLQAGLDICDQYDISALTARGVAAMLGLTPMVLYRHFESMDCFRATVWNCSYALLNRELWAGDHVLTDCEAALRGFLRGLAVFGMAHPKLFWFMNRTRFVPERYGLTNQRRQGFACLVDLLQCSRECGAMNPDPDPLLAAMRTAYTMLGATLILITPREAKITEWDSEKLIASVIDHILACLSGPSDYSAL